MIPFIAKILRKLLGFFFIFSALTKFIDLDRLYIYIYSFDLFSLDFSIVIGWMVISLELLIGVFLIAGRHRKPTAVVTLLTLIGFSLFLAYALIVGRSDSCHCMGEALPFDPISSILKNVVLILLVLFVCRFGYDENDHYKSSFLRYVLPPLTVLLPGILLAIGGFLGWWNMDYYDLQYSLTLTACMSGASILLTLPCWSRWYWQLSVLLTPIVAIFVLATYVPLFGRHNGEPYNEAVLQRQIAAGGLLRDAHINEGRKVVSLYSVNCSYCRLAAQKISLIQQNAELPFEQFVNIFPGNESTDVSPFFENDQMVRYAQHMLVPDTFLHITYGQFPLIMLMDEGRVVQTFGPGDISESEIRKFLQQ